MLIDRDLPVGFQNMTCEVRLRAKQGTPQRRLETFRVVAEGICVVQRTLRSPPQIRTTFDMTEVVAR